MNAEELRALRTKWGLTQLMMAERMGLNRRAYIDLETGDRILRQAHILAIERASLDIAAERGEPALILASLHTTLNALASLLSSANCQVGAEPVPTAGAEPAQDDDDRTADSPPGRTRHDHEAILQAWERGETSSKIAARIDTSPGYVRTVVKKARESGDPRATMHANPPSSGGLRRDLDHEGILDRWASGWRAEEIARFAHTSVGTIYDLIITHRRRGDERARRRRRPNPS